MIKYLGLGHKWNRRSFWGAWCPLGFIEGIWLDRRTDCYECKTTSIFNMNNLNP